MDEAFAFVREAGDTLDAKADDAAQALPEGPGLRRHFLGVSALRSGSRKRARGARGALLL